MAKARVLPGVQVSVVKEVVPPLPAPSGIVGIIGVTDKGPDKPKHVSSYKEFKEIFGPASAFSMPEAKQILQNGAFELVVARVSGGSKSELILKDKEGDDVVILQARANGPWSENVKVTVKENKVEAEPGIEQVSNVDLTLSYNGTVETFRNLSMKPDDEKYLFDVVNAGSELVTAIDPKFRTDPPDEFAAKSFLGDVEVAASKMFVDSGDNNVITFTAKKAGPDGNNISVEIKEGTQIASAILQDAGAANVIQFLAKKAGSDWETTTINVTEKAENASNVDITVTPPANKGNPTSYTDLADMDAILTEMANDPYVIVKQLDTNLPAVTAPPVALSTLLNTVNVIVRKDRYRKTYKDNWSLDAIVEAISDDADAIVTATKEAGVTALPDYSDPDKAKAFLEGGRTGWRCVLLMDSEEIAELLALPGVDGSTLTVTLEKTGETINGAVAFTIKLYVDNELKETHENLTMDPDTDTYLLSINDKSSLVEANDLFKREHALTLPKAVVDATLTGGTSPTTNDYTKPLGDLESEELVDTVVASFQTFSYDGSLNVATVHAAIEAHCRRMSEDAKNRIGFGTVGPDESSLIKDIKNRAVALNSDRFVLVAPHGVLGAVAGRIASLNYYESPTFKKISGVSELEHSFSISQLRQLVLSNVLALELKAARGIIMEKGVATDGSQISVTRVADTSVRRTKKIADRFIGTLHNEDNRTALKQMIVGMLTQMEKDGAIVPSVDGTEPAFLVDVYASQQDFAMGICRVDIAVRPVRAIDYIYATILVKI